MPTVLFRSRLREGVSERFGAHSERIYGLAHATPGFVSSKDFVAADGERLAVIEWESDEALAAFRDHPDHRAAQGLGREVYFEEYLLQICQVVRSSRFSRAE